MTGIRDELRARNRAGTRLSLWQAEVVRNVPVGPGIVRVTVGGPGVDGFEVGELPADAIKLAVPAEPGDPPPQLRLTPDGPRTDGPDPAFRPYTVRAHRPRERELDLDVVLHGDGPGVRWARSARPGEKVQWFGPRSEFWACPDVDAHLLVGDRTGWPAVAAILDALPAGPPCRVLVSGDAAPYLPAARLEPVRDSLLDAVAGCALPAGRVQAWVAGEAGMVRDVRRHLLGSRGIDRADLHSTGYWRRGMTVTQTDRARLAAERSARESGSPVDDHHEIDLADLDPVTSW